MKIFYSILFCVLTLFVCSQETKFEKNNDFKYDTSYVQVFEKYISIENSLARNGLNVLIGEVGGSKIRYAINQKVQLGYKINWRFINFGFAIQLPIINNDDDKYGKTSGFNLNFTSQIKRKVILDIFFLNQKGLYIANAPNIIANFDRSGNYPSYQKMGVNYFGIDANYIFNNKKYTFKAPLNINEIQKKSSGSLFIGGYFFLSNIYNSNGLLNDSLDISFDKLKASTAMGSINFGFSIGYGHNLVIKKHGIISATGYLGFGPGFSTIEKKDGEKIDKVILSGRYKIRLMGAYMSKNVSVGIRTLIGVLPNSASDKVRIYYETDHIAFFFSYRFLPIITQNKMAKRALKN